MMERSLAERDGSRLEALERLAAEAGVHSSSWRTGNRRAFSGTLNPPCRSPRTA